MADQRPAGRPRPGPACLSCRLLQQQRGSSANNHNPRRPICRPAPLFRLPPPPPSLQLMMIALAPRPLCPLSRSRGIYSGPSFIRLIHCSGIIVRGGQFGFGEWGDENWGWKRERERKMDGGRTDGFIAGETSSALSRGAQSIRHPNSAPSAIPPAPAP